MEHTKIKSLITNGLKATDEKTKREALVAISAHVSTTEDLARVAEEEKEVERKKMHEKIEKAIEKQDLPHFENGQDDEENYLDIDYSSYKQCVDNSKEIERIVGDIANEYGYYVRVYHRFIDGSSLKADDVIANEGAVDEIKELLKNTFKGKVDFDDALHGISQKLYDGIGETGSDETKLTKTPYEIEQILNECLTSELQGWTEIESDDDGETKENEISFKVYVTNLDLLPDIYNQLVEKSEELTKETNTEITLWFFVTDEG